MLWRVSPLLTPPVRCTTGPPRRLSGDHSHTQAEEKWGGGKKNKTKQQDRPTPGEPLSCQLTIAAANICRLTVVLSDRSTSNIRPRRITMAKHDTISAWFWITNSWLSTGGLLFFLRKPMAHRHGSPPPPPPPCAGSGLGRR